MRSILQKTPDRDTGHRGSLRQAAKAYGTALTGQLFEHRLVRNIVPRRSVLDLIAGFLISHKNRYETGRMSEIISR
jgi:hypothetical protein